MDCNEARTKLAQLIIDLKVAKENNAQRHKDYKEAFRNYTLAGKEVERLEKEFKHLKQTIETENMFDSVNNVEGFNLLSNEELFAISIGIDKTDYRKSSCSTEPRFHELQRVVEEIIKIKKQYTGWVFTGLKCCGQYDTLPPQRFLTYHFTTPEGFDVSV
jgi:hypothetical protein